MEAQITLQRWSAFREGLAALARRAERLGLEPPSYERLTDAPVERDVGLPPDGARKVRRLVWPVRLTGTLTAPQLAGWELLGKLDFVSAAPGVLRKFRPGVECPEAFHDVGPERCDHCGTLRRRNQSFVLRHEDGREVVVGRTCLGDFLGHGGSAETTALRCDLETEVWELLASGSRGFVDGDEADPAAPGWGFWDPLRTLELVCAEVRRNGFVSRKQAETSTDLVQTTRDVLAAVLTARTQNEREAARAFRAGVTDADRALARDVLDWACKLSGRSDFEANLRTSLMAEVTLGSLGFVAAAPSAFLRSREDRGALAEPLGEVGVKVEFVGRVVGAWGRAGSYGWTTTIKIVSEAGHVALWYASGQPDVPLHVPVRVRGAVKSYGVSRGVFQTTLTRCKIAVE